VAVQIKVKGLSNKLENEVEEWTRHIMGGYMALTGLFSFTFWC
jgi:hypothetical protein